MMTDNEHALFIKVNAAAPEVTNSMNRVGISSYHSYYDMQPVVRNIVCNDQLAGEGFGGVG